MIKSILKESLETLYSIIKESSETRSMSDSREHGWKHDRYPILNGLETRSIFDTQPTVGDTIDIQYCLTEGKRLDDGQSNL